MRKDLLIEGQVYHIFTRSIAAYKIFNNDHEYARMLDAISYYQREKPEIKFSQFLLLEQTTQHTKKEFFRNRHVLVDIIAYCFMPTHIHLILRQNMQNGISIFMSNILNSYTRYFNIKHKRKGPLWESRFKNVLVEDDDYLLHLTRYVHLNPVTAELVDKPEEWVFSSYKEYLLPAAGGDKICSFNDVVDTDPSEYKRFVEDRSSYQRQLARIKSLLLDGDNEHEPTTTYAVEVGYRGKGGGYEKEEI